jgi:hypothetical protein
VERKLNHFEKIVADGPNDDGGAEDADDDAAGVGGAETDAATGADYRLGPDCFTATWTFPQNHGWCLAEAFYNRKKIEKEPGLTPRTGPTRLDKLTAGGPALFLGGANFHGDHGAIGSLYVPGEADPGHHEDQIIAGIEFPPAEAVAGRSREGVMVVVPPFTEAEDAEEEIVSAVIVAGKRPCAPDVADGIDAPGHMMNQENAGESAPEEAEQEAHPGMGEPGTKKRGDDEAEDGPENPEFADDAHEAVALEVGDVLGEVLGIAAENPADVSVPHAVEDAPESLAVVMG